VRLPDDSSAITAVEDLFTYHIFGTPARLTDWRRDVGTYALAVSGLAARPVSLSVERLRNDFEPVAADMVLQCMTNVHWGRLRITGARLLDVLEYAGMREEARKVALHAADGFDSDLSVEAIRGQPDAFLLAYAMNDQPLPPDHGFPVRLAADGRYGYKWPKWLKEIELVDHDFRGHYEGRRGWSDEGRRGERVM